MSFLGSGERDRITQHSFPGRTKPSLYMAVNNSKDKDLNFAFDIYSILKKRMLRPISSPLNNSTPLLAPANFRADFLPKLAAEA